MRIKRIIIKGLFECKSFDWNLNDINILVGKNGSGKTNLLQLINSLMLLRAYDNNFSYYKNNKSKSLQREKYLKILDRVISLNIIFSNNEKISFRRLDIDNDIKNIILSLEKEKENKENLQEVFNLINQLHKTSRRIKMVNPISISYSPSKKILKTRLIHTTRALANSSSTFFSNGDEGSVIDLEVRNGLTELFSYKEKAEEEFTRAKKTLTDNINLLFSESEKTVEINERTIIIKEKGKKLISKIFPLVNV